jgi:hypothetical protein
MFAGAETKTAQDEASSVDKPATPAADDAAAEDKPDAAAGMGALRQPLDHGAPKLL